MSRLFRLTTPMLAVFACVATYAEVADAQSPTTPPPIQQDRPQAMPGAPDAETRAARDAFRDARRAMMAEGRIAALRGGLALTPEQAPLWRPVEEALRGLTGSRPPLPPFAASGEDPVARLRVVADRARARADALSKLADALGPLQASFSDEQKLRFRALQRHLLGAGPMMGPGPRAAGPMRHGPDERGGWRGHEMERQHGDGPRGGWRGGPGEGRMDRGEWRGDWRGEGEGRLAPRPDRDRRGEAPIAPSPETTGAISSDASVEVADVFEWDEGE